MNLYVIFLIAAALAGLVGGAGLILAGYKWGSFAALQALAQNSPKWKAYLLAMLPPGGFALAFLMDANLSPFASEMFWTLATPAVIGACFKYNRGNYSTF